MENFWRVFLFVLACVFIPFIPMCVIVLTVWFVASINVVAGVIWMFISVAGAVAALICFIDYCIVEGWF